MKAEVIVDGFSGAPDGKIYPQNFAKGSIIEGELAETAVRHKLAKEVKDEKKLRDDGPTVEEYVKAGYDPNNYPPKGYASRSTEDEIAAAIKAFAEAAAKK